MNWIDWIIVGLMLALVAGIAIYTQRFVKGVADFLAAGRVAGRYVVAVSSGEAAMGLISMVAIWEMYYKSGFAVEFWQRLSIPIGLVLMVTGYCIYRYRETRALTMGQMLEIRYSRRFRIFAGCLSALSGIINYGLFPAVGARFIVYFCGLPQQLSFLGMQWPTFAVIMAVFLAAAAVIAMMGGQITVMTTDCVMGDSQLSGLFVGGSLSADTILLVERNCPGFVGSSGRAVDAESVRYLGSARL